MKIVIMQGPSGAGKSTYIKNHFPGARVCSADNFFMKDGKYVFDPRKLPEAHAKCLRDFAFEVNYWAGVEADNRSMETPPVLVVDNTNTTALEIAPYYQLGLAYGHHPEVISIQIGCQTAAMRNVHGVPHDTIMAMQSRILRGRKDYPKWWKVTEVDAEGV